jgi:deazaflavin-dependent oxidoreductase (nitroreductase family)
MRFHFVSVRVTRLHAWLLRRSGGRLRRSWLFAAGQPVISLTTTGRRTGQPRSTAVACFVDGDRLHVAAMNLGQQRDPSWAINLTADPRATVTIAGQTASVLARRLYGQAAERAWSRWLQLQPSAQAFQRIAQRPIPIFVLERVE